MKIDSPEATDIHDIRPDLRLRIRMLEDHLERLNAEFADRAEKLEKERKSRIDQAKTVLSNYRRLLDLENLVTEHVQADLAAKGETRKPTTEEIQSVASKMPIPEARAPLAEFFVTQLRERGPKSKEELRSLAEAAGYFQKGEGGRSTHATLVNIVRNRTVIDQGDGTYRAPAEKKEDLFW